MQLTKFVSGRDNMRSGYRGYPRGGARGGRMLHGYRDDRTSATPHPPQL